MTRPSEHDAAHAEYVAEAVRFARCLGSDPDAEHLTPNESRIITLAREVMQQRGAVPLSLVDGAA